MGRSENFKQYAADCVRQAAGEQPPEDKAILLNVALAWVRLAQQSQAATANPAEPRPDCGATARNSGAAPATA